MQGRVGLFVFALLAAGCARLGSGVDAGAAGEGAHPASMSTRAPSSMQRVPQKSGADPLRGFARLPDRGELLQYEPATVRRDGAYTWHRADISEAHALHALAAGHLYVTTPDGQRLDFQYDRHVEHASGDWTWVGHIAGRPSEQAILTFGSDAAFGSIAQAGKLPLRMTVRDGASWLVETDPAKLASINSAAAHPRRPDYHIVSESELPRRRDGVLKAADGTTSQSASPAPVAAAATGTAGTTVDLLIGYTPGFATANNGTSGAMTRLNYLVDVTNATYINSQVGAQVRLVKAMQVDYTDGNTNDTALEEMSGYKSGTGSVTPNAAFSALRAAREQYSADLVSLVRDFMDPEQGGCGIAWLLGGGLQGINPGEGWDELGYSVVSDGVDQGTDGKGYYCLDETLAHEVGHNMGAAHDRQTAQGDDGVLNNPGDYGAYSYSFGYKSTSTANFYTVMAYGDSGQRIYPVFSSPRTTFCGGYACGTADTDNARTLSQLIPVVASFRASIYLAPGVGIAGDFNGDGRADLLWRNGATGANALWKSADSTTPQAISAVANLGWNVVGIGDFDGDHSSDILWRNRDTGANAVWRSANAGSSLAISAVTNLAWMVVGVGDFNGDNKDDILWRNGSVGANTIWRSGNAATSQQVATVSNPAWQVAAIADFNGDGRDDILWRNYSTGANAIWRSGDAASQQAVLAVSNLEWTIVGTGDFDGDGRADILWRNLASGANVIWRAADGHASQALAAVSNLAWSVAATGDFNADGQADIVWRNRSTGANAIWRSGNAANAQYVTAVTNLAWHIVP